MKKTVLDIVEMKRKGEKISYLCCYDYAMAARCEKAGLDMLLVGDSIGMVVYGFKGTIPVTMEQMIPYAQIIRRGAPNTFIVADMPFLSYQLSAEQAVLNAGRFYKEADVDAVKVEGGRVITDQIKAIVDAGMSVQGHIGLTPQTAGQLGGFKAQGRTAESTIGIIKDALAVEKAGAFSIILEAVPVEVGKAISKVCKIPIIGVGAGMEVDGQALIVNDVLGMGLSAGAKFVKRFAELGEGIEKGLSDYVAEVKAVKFPEEKHCYKMLEGEAEKLEALLKKGLSG
ncbi:3-methyl-2-oxobutanoate hydroxymethyltransferase [Chloroflexota bacterium]